jgi:pilus assembly protein CpaE
VSNLAVITDSSAFEWRVKFAIGASPNVELRRWRDEYLRIDPTKVVAEVADEPLDVVCLGPGLDLDTALELAAAFERDHPEICVLLAADPTAELWQQAVRAGAREVVSPEASPDDLQRAFANVLETAQRRRGKLTGPAEPTGPERRVISVVSPKGGSGKTTVSVNLAVELARRSPGQVAIVDLDLQFGDVATALQLRPEHSLADVARAGTAVETTALKVFLVSHTSGLWALCSPPSPAEADEIGSAHVGHVLGLLSAQFPLVVVDTSAGLHEGTLAALDMSTDLVIVCPMDVAGVRSLRKELDALDLAGVTTSRRHLVLNRADSRVGISPHDIEEVLGMEVDISIPSARSVPLSMNEGVPLVESNPRSPVALRLQELANRFSNSIPEINPSTPESTAPKGSWLSRHRKETR